MMVLFIMSKKAKSRYAPYKVSKKDRKKTDDPRSYALRSSTPVYGVPQTILPVGFPRTTVYKLRYVEGITLNPSTGTVVSQKFRANGIFDPYAETGGHQPYGFDQLATYYNHYVVLGSKCTATFCAEGTSNTAMLAVGVLLKADTSFPSGITELTENGLAKFKMISATNRQTPLTVTQNYSAKKFFNVKDVSDNVTRLGSAFTADPSEQAIFHVFAGSASPIEDPGGI